MWRCNEHQEARHRGRGHGRAARGHEEAVEAGRARVQPRVSVHSPVCYVLQYLNYPKVRSELPAVLEKEAGLSTASTQFIPPDPR